MKTFGLIGEKLGHSLSPIIHQSIYKHLNINASYSLYQVNPQELSAAVLGIKALGIDGVNVTIPYKIKIMDYLNKLSSEADAIGAVNTISNQSGCLTGYNTDYIGFGRMLEKYHLPVQGKTAVVLGSGGASKSVSAYLLASGIAELIIVTRNSEGLSLKDGCRIITYDQVDNLMNIDLLINCTPVGMYPDIAASPLKHSDISRFKAVIDLIYNPGSTKLMQQANSLGVPSYNGLYMLIAQAVAAVEIWNGASISEEIVDNIYSDLKNILKI